MKKMKPALIAVSILLSMLPFTLPAQWSTDPAMNNLISGLSGDPGPYHLVDGTLAGTITLSGGTGNVTQVLVQASSYTTNPDASGYYSMVVPSGTYTVTASLAGYTSASQIVIVTPANITTVNLTLNSTVGEEAIHAPGLTVFPNPTAGMLNFVSAEPINRIDAMNSIGELIFSLDPAASEYRADLSSCPAGIYYLVIKTASKTYIRKVIRN
ncbi:MAG: T9SS type A sorting domain-containing protein [Bacteroidetes bacterium]|nr:T9SS type A sorting domain-containing protein [Bacteroidota bacterium]